MNFGAPLQEFFLRGVHLHPIYGLVSPLDVVDIVVFGAINSIKRCGLRCSRSKSDFHSRDRALSILLSEQLEQALHCEVEFKASLSRVPRNLHVVGLGQVLVSLPMTRRETSTVVSLVGR